MIKETYKKIPFWKPPLLFFYRHSGKILLLACLLFLIGIFSPWIFLVAGFLILFLAISWRHLLVFFFYVPFLSLLRIRKKNGMRKLYLEKSCFSEKGELLGKLFYEKDLCGRPLPILEIYTEKPEELGYVQGYLLGPYLEEIIYLVLNPMIRLSSFITRDFFKRNLKIKTKKLKIPKSIFEEIDGMIKGIDQYAIEAKTKRTITHDHLIYGNTFMDVYKAIGRKSFLSFFVTHSLGCSLAVIKRDNETIVGRTLDWPSFGLLGSYTLIKRYRANGKWIETQTPPGMIGALSAKSEENLIVLVNECANISLSGIPYLFFARYLIENCSSVDEVKNRIEACHGANQTPASSHHLTAIDRNKAINFQFYPKRDIFYLERVLEKDGKLIVSNHAIDKGNKVIENTISNPGSIRRFEILDQMINQDIVTNKTLKEIIRESLMRASSIETIAAMIYHFTDGTIATQYTYDDYYSGDHLE